MTGGLPDDWQPPEQRLLARAWSGHPQVDLLNERQAERDEDGEPRWMTTRQPDPEDSTITEIWQRPVDPRDAREPIRITRYPQDALDDRLRGDQAVADEHADD